MKSLKPLVGLLLVIILGIGTYLFVYKPDQTRKLREAQERFLVHGDADMVTSLTLGRSDSTIVIEKMPDNKDWYIVAPISGEAENEEILKLQFFLRETNILYVVDETLDNLSSYGLADPREYLAVQFENGDTDTLYLGMYTPDGSMGYVRLASDDRVVAIERDSIDMLKRPVQAFRARTILNVFTTDINGIEIMRDDNETLKFQHDGIAWRMTEPYMISADEDNLVSLVSSIGTETKRLLVAEHAEDLGLYGLNNPGVVLKVTRKGGLPEKMLLIGDEFASSSTQVPQYFAKQFDQDVVFSINATLVNDLTKKMIWFIDKFPSKFNRDQIDRIVVQTGNTEIVIVRGSGNYWSIVEPVDLNIEESLISQIFTISRFMIANDIVSFEPDDETVHETGLDSPQMIISFYDGNTLIESVEYGDTLIHEMQNTYVRTSSHPAIYVIRNDVSGTMNTLLNKVYE